MDKTSNIFIAGRYGMVGSAIERALRRQGYTNICGLPHAKLDLTDQTAVEHFFRWEQPTYVFFAAAKVGGINANNTYRAEFIYSNLEIQNNIIHACYTHGVEKLLFLGSSCIYPRDCRQPIKEEYLLSGPLEETNKPYAVAKIAGITMCQSYNQQHGTNFICAMPTNLYGPKDNYHPETSHVLPGLIHKFHVAKMKCSEYITLWGTGSPLREFLYADDVGDACVLLMEKYTGNDIVNIGSGYELTIARLADLISKVVGFRGHIRWDDSMPDGTPRKLLDVSKLAGMGWKPKIGLMAGLSMAYESYLRERRG